MSNKFVKQYFRRKSAFYRGLPRGVAIVQIALLCYASGAQFVFAQAETAVVEPVPLPQETQSVSILPSVTPEAAALPLEPSQSDPVLPSVTEPPSDSSLPVSEGGESGVPPPAGDVPPEGEPPASAGGTPAPPYSSVQPVPASYNVRPGVDQSTGALTYRYPFTLPPGRGGMTPELALVYNSQDRRDGSPVGYGWNLSLPTIERQNLTGINHFFTDEYFASSLSGELVRIAAGEVPGNFAARVDDGSFIRYAFAGNIWTAKTKNGTTYAFGSTDAARLFDVNGNPNNVARWLIDRIEDTNGNRISFTYVRDLNQLYLDQISYTDTVAGAGPFLVTSVRELRPEADRHISYANGFKTETRYRASEIRISVSGQRAAKYILGYTQSPTNNRSLLASVTQTSYDDAGAPTALPPTSFAYTVSNLGFSAADPNPFATVEQIATSSLRHGFLMADINGDAYTDLVRSLERAGSQIDRHVWLNDRAGSLIESTTWTGTSTQIIICHERLPFELCDPEGTAIFDTNGDLLLDMYRAPGGGAARALNLGNGWGEPVSLGSAYSLLVGPNHRPSLAAFDGANPPFVIGIDDANGMGGAYGTDPRFGVRVADLNHDGLPDAARSTGTPGPPETTLGLDEGIYLSRGIDSVGVLRLVPINWLFLNGTNIGANAPARNAYFEQNAYKGAFFADVNGDELPDVIVGSDTNNVYNIYRHTGNAWVFDSSFSYTIPSKGLETADMNGDGLLDFVVSDGCGPIACATRAFLNTGQAPDLLETVILPAGGTVTAAYQASSLYKDAGGALLNPNLPMAIWTVRRITETDSITGLSGTTVYEYAGGKYFFQSLTNRRFAGFARVTATKPDGSTTATHFTVSEDGKIGKPFRTDLLDAAGASVKRTLTSWTVTPLSSIGGSRFLTVPDAAVTMDFDSGGSHRDRAARSTYNTATGALLTTLDYGEVNADAATSTPVFTDLGSDARTTTYTYATDPAGVLELPATETLTDFAGVTAARTRTYYDNLPLGQASAGNRTKVERLIDAAAGTYATTQWTYTPTGLVQTETDPLNHTTTFTYDALGLYPATVSNALNQQTISTYDYTSGKPVTVTDPNGELRRTVYDGLDRVTEEWVPRPADGAAVLARTATYTDEPNRAAAHEQSLAGGSPVVNTHAIDLEDANMAYLFASASSSFSITGDMTVELWFKAESIPTPGGMATIASRWESNGGRSWLFYYADNAFWFTVATGPSSGTVTASAPYQLAANTWYHAAVVYTAAESKAEFAVNGFSIGVGAGLPAALLNTSAPFTIGAYLSGGVPYPGGTWDGLIDDARVWNEARSISAIRQSIQGRVTGNLARLKAHWKLDNDFLDASGNNNALQNPANAPFVTDVPFGSGASPAFIASESYLYFDGFGRAVQKRERAEGTGPGGLPAFTALDTRYDGKGRVERVSLPYASSGAARTPPATSPIVNTAYQYDAADRVVNVTDAVGVTVTVYDRWDTAVTDANNHAKRFGRDAFGRLARVEEFLSAGANPYVTSYAYDAAENLKKITDAEGNVRNFTYDARGLRLSVEDLHAPASDAADSAPAFGTYAFAYDAAGNLTQKQTPKGEVIAYGYDALNRPLTEDFLGAPGTEVTNVYDSCAHGIGRRCGATTAGASRTFAYDLAGNVASETTAVGGAPYASFYAYDQLGNVTRVTHPDNSATLYTINESGRAETVSWQETAISPAVSLVTNLDYAPHGATAKIMQANGLEETFLYDALAKYRLAEHVVGPAGSGAPPAAGPNTHSIDLESGSSQYLSAPDSASLSITHDLTLEAWVKLESLPGTGSAFAIAGKWEGNFDDPGRSYVFRYSKPGNGGTGILNLLISSDGNAWSGASKTYGLETAVWHHLAVVYTASLGRAEFFVDGSSIGTASGLPTSIHDNASAFGIGARGVGSVPDDLMDGLVDDVRVWGVARSAADINGNKSVELTGAEPDLHAYWKLNNSLADVIPTGNTLSNPAGAVFVTDVPFAGGSGAPPSAASLSRRAYSYDPVGNVLSIVEAQGACPATQPCGNATTTSAYAYDGLDRLLDATVTTQTATTSNQTVSNYTYGATGNLLTSPAGVYTYSGFSGGAFVNPHAATAVGSRTLAYDWNGNLISDTGGASNVANSWNYRNELTNTTITGGGQMSVNYGYDVSGQRVSLTETAAGLTTATRFPTPSYSETIRADGTVERVVSVEAAGLPVATIRTVGTSTPEVFATHTDHLRSTRLVTSEASGLGTVNIVEQTDYDPFGKITRHEQTGDFAERHKYTSHEFDASTSYTYAKARYLDTSAGRFASQDPKFIYNPEQLLEDPQQQNSYAYARNNPVRFVDPDGESVKDVVLYGVGLLNSVSSNFLLGAGRQSVSDVSYQRGQFAGDIISTGLGVIEAGLGAVGAAGGGALCLTGAGCVAGAPAVAAGAATAAHGAGVAGVAGAKIAEKGGYLFSEETGSSQRLRPGDTIGGLKLTKHGVETLYDRGATTQQVETALQEGKPYLDTKKGTVLWTYKPGTKSAFTVVTNKAKDTIVSVENFVRRLDTASAIRRFRPLDP